MDNEIDKLKLLIGSKIKSEREKSGQTQEQFSVLIGRSVPALSNMERGQSLPTLDILLVISKVLGFRMQDYFAFQDDIAFPNRLASKIKLNTYFDDLNDLDAKLALQIVGLMVENQKAKD